LERSQSDVFMVLISWAVRQWQDFMVPAFLAAKHQNHFARPIIHLLDQPQLIRTAMQAGHVELAERTFAGCLAGLIILAPHEISRCIHPRSFRDGVGQRRSRLKQFRLFLELFQRRAVEGGQR